MALRIGTGDKFFGFCLKVGDLALKIKRIRRRFLTMHQTLKRVQTLRFLFENW